MGRSADRQICLSCSVKCRSDLECIARHQILSDPAEGLDDLYVISVDRIGVGHRKGSGIVLFCKSNLSRVCRRSESVTGHRGSGDILCYRVLSGRHVKRLSVLSQFGVLDVFYLILGSACCGSADREGRTGRYGHLLTISAKDLLEGQLCHILRIGILDLQSPGAVLCDSYRTGVAGGAHRISGDSACGRILCYRVAADRNCPGVSTLCLQLCISYSLRPVDIFTFCIFTNNRSCDREREPAGYGHLRAAGCKSLLQCQLAFFCGIRKRCSALCILYDRSCGTCRCSIVSCISSLGDLIIRTFGEKIDQDLVSMLKCECSALFDNILGCCTTGRSESIIILCASELLFCTSVIRIKLECELELLIGVDIRLICSSYSLCYLQRAIGQLIYDLCIACGVALNGMIRISLTILFFTCIGDLVISPDELVSLRNIIGCLCYSVDRIALNVYYTNNITNIQGLFKFLS